MVEVEETISDNDGDENRRSVCDRCHQPFADRELGPTSLPTPFGLLLPDPMFPDPQDAELGRDRKQYCQSCRSRLNLQRRLLCLLLLVGFPLLAFLLYRYVL